MIDGASPDVVAFVEASGDGAVVFESVGGALDGVAVLVLIGVEGGWASAAVALLLAVAYLVGAFGMTARMPRWRR
jgi:hypothetical protein